QLWIRDARRIEIRPQPNHDQCHRRLPIMNTRELGQDLHEPAPAETVESVAGHVVDAWLRLRAFVLPSDPRRVQRLLADLRDVVADQLTITSRNYLVGPDRETVLGHTASALSQLGPVDVDLGTIRDELLGLAGGQGSNLNLMLSDVAAFLVETYLALPEFADPPANLPDQGPELRKRLEEALRTLPHRRSVRSTGMDAGAYQTDYLRAVANRLDTLEILGVDLARMVERYSLTTAFVALSASIGDGEASGRQNDVPNVLAASRTLVLIGEAGSGKTTLLQWIAVSAARNQLPPQLAHWAHKVPFLVRLRRFAAGSPPDVEDFPAEVAATLSGRKPAGWCSDVLRGGNGIVLIDGLDELPAPRRPEIQSWLDDLLGAYPDNIFVITTRPAAFRDRGFKLTGLDTAYLLPMGPPQITALIRQWHKSTSQGPDDTAHHAKGELVANHILQTPALVDLARTPLLCAVLCALAYNLKGVGSLPRRRVELYDAALTMLTGRRDTDRRLTASLGSAERLALLEDLAQWLVRNGQSEIPREQALRHVERTLRSLRHVNINAEDALRDLLERSVLREPAIDMVDFVHRTFEEYLAARWMNEQGDLGALLDRANDAAFAEVITLVAGLSRRQDATRLMLALLDKADDPESGVPHALVMSCIEACLVVDPRVFERASAYLAGLIPPADAIQVEEVVAGGSTAVPLLSEYLAASVNRSWVHFAPNCVDTLAKIGSPEAFQVLADLPEAKCVLLVHDLVAAWSYFAPVEYVTDVLKPLGGPLEVHGPDPGRLAFTGLAPADYQFSPLVTGEDIPLLPGARLHSVWLSDPAQPTDFDALAEVEGLVTIRIIGLNADFDWWEWFPELTPAPSVRSVDVDSIVGNGPNPLNALAFTVFTNLVELRVDLTDYPMTDLGALNKLERLELLELDHASGLDHPVTLNLPRLRVLRVAEWPFPDFTMLAGCTNLEVLDVTDGRVESLTGLESLSNLRQLTLRNCDLLTDLGGLEELQFVDELDLRGCTSLNDSAADVMESVPRGAEVETEGSSLDRPPGEDWLPEATPENLFSTYDVDKDGDEYFVAAVEGWHIDDYSFIDINGWIVGMLAEIEYPSSAEAMAEAEPAGQDLPGTPS
ncbi:NACHT domain-containing protein, partial [Kibdelosporangium lantanae]